MKREGNYAFLELSLFCVASNHASIPPLPLLRGMKKHFCRSNYRVRRLMCSRDYALIIIGHCLTIQQLENDTEKIKKIKTFFTFPLRSLWIFVFWSRPFAFPAESRPLPSLSLISLWQWKSLFNQTCDCQYLLFQENGVQILLYQMEKALLFIGVTLMTWLWQTRKTIVN